VVDEVLFREGDWVVKDQTLLVRVEPRKYEALLAQAEATLKKAEANVKRWDALAKRTEASVTDAEQTLSLRKTVMENIRRAGRSVKA
jgi:multidrug resistance efflux pump